MTRHRGTPNATRGLRLELESTNIAATRRSKKMPSAADQPYDHKPRNHGLATRINGAVVLATHGGCRREPLKVGSTKVPLRLLPGIYRSDRAFATEIRPDLSKNKSLRETVMIAWHGAVGCGRGARFGWRAGDDSRRDVARTLFWEAGRLRTAPPRWGSIRVPVCGAGRVGTSIAVARRGRG